MLTAQLGKKVGLSTVASKGSFVAASTLRGPVCHFSSEAASLPGRVGDQPRVKVSYFDNVKAKNPPQVLISGSTIEALALGVALAKKNIPVHIVSKSSRFHASEPVSFIPPNMVRMFDYLGWSTMEEQSLEIRYKTISDSKQNQILTLPFEVSDRAFERSFAIQTPRILGALSYLARKHKITYSLGVQATSWKKESDGTYKVHFSDNRVPRHYDLIVAADGLKSKIRDLTFNKELMDMPQAQHVLYGAVIDASPKFPESTILEMRADERRLVVLPFTKGKAYVTVQHQDRDASFLASHTFKGDDFMAMINDNFSGPWKKEIVAALYKAKPHTFSRKIPQEQYCRLLSQDRIALVGKAAHSIFPYLGQHEAIGVEDACLLASCLATYDVDRALYEYSAMRIPRISQIRKYARDDWVNVVQPKKKEEPKGRIQQFREKVTSLFKKPIGFDQFGIAKEAWNNSAFSKSDPALPSTYKRPEIQKSEKAIKERIDRKFYLKSKEYMNPKSPLYRYQQKKITALERSKREKQEWFKQAWARTNKEFKEAHQLLKSKKAKEGMIAGETPEETVSRLAKKKFVKRHRTPAKKRSINYSRLAKKFVLRQK